MKFNKNKLIKYSVLLLIIISVGVFINETLNKPTELNYLLASRVYKAPANTAFTDNNFYKCVVDAYNSTNGTSIAYTVNLTDDQLKTIDYLKCYGYAEKIGNVNGIEKLVNLRYLSLTDNLITNINLHNNLNLISLYLAGNKLTELDVSNNLELQMLDIGRAIHRPNTEVQSNKGNNITELDLSNNLKLTYLYAQNNQLTSLDVSNNSELVELEASNNKLTSLDLSNNSELVELEASNNKLTELDVSNNLELERLNVGANNLSKLDVSQNRSLVELNVAANQLTGLDVNNNKALKILYLSNNKLASLDVSHNSALKYLYAQNNQLTSLDASYNSALTYLYAQNNQLTSLDVSNDLELKELHAENNQLTSLDISDNKVLKILYLYNNKLASLDVSNNLVLKELPLYNNALTEIDLSNNLNLTYLDLENNKLNKIILNENLDSSLSNIFDIIGVQSTNQTYINLGGNKIIAPISEYIYKLSRKIIIPKEVGINEFISNMGIDNLTVKIYNNEEEITEGSIRDNYRLKIYDGENIIQNLIIYVHDNKDFLDPAFYRCVVDKYNLSNTPKISYTENLTNEQLEKITNLVCGGNVYTSASGVGKMTMLTSLTLMQGNLTEIDVSKNVNLIYLVLSQNNITKLDVSQNEELISLNVNSNELTSIEVSHNSKLERLEVSNNKLTSLDVSKNVALTSLYLSYNNLAEIDVSKNVALTSLSLGYNKLTSLDVSKNVALTSLGLNNNNLTEVDVSNNTTLTELDVSNNKLTSLDVSKNVALTSLKLYDNPFTKNIGAYKGSERSLSNINFIKLPEEKTTTISKISSNSENVIITDNGVEINKSGVFEVSVIYKHDIQTSNNGYSGTYNIYVIEATSEKYLINEEEEYIYTGIDTDEETILNNISLNYGEASIENNKLIIKYENEVVKEFDIVNISSDKYDLTKDYIFEYEENNITINNGTINKNIENNTIEIKYGEDILETYKLVDVNSEKYDLSSSTIKVQDNTINNFLESINCINCEAKIYDGTKYIIEGDFTENNKLRIMYDQDVLKDYNLTFPVSGVTLNKENVRLGLENKKTVQLEATINPKNARNKNISWTSSNEEVATVNENGLVTSKGIGKTTITATTEEGGYTDTVEIEVVDIITYQITYKDGENTYIEEEYEEDEVVELKNDLTKEGYTLIGWKCDDKEYKLTDEFTMIAEDITLEAIWELIIPNIEETSEYKVKKNIITGISLGTTIENLDLGLDDIYEVKIYNKNQEVKTEENIATSDKLKIYLGDILVSEYTLSVKGDVTGTGTSTVSDVAKLYQYLKKKIDMEDCYKEAGNVVSTDNEIKINDVAKLYQFIKKKISSLED